MPAEWPSEESRQSFISFLEMELRLRECASRGESDVELMGELDSLLKNKFPRTTAYIQKSLSAKAPGESAEHLRTIAWAEARSTPGSDGHAEVDGSWTREDIQRDIEECLDEARRRARGA